MNKIFNITKNKDFLFNFNKIPNIKWYDFEFHLSTVFNGRDHAGPGFTIIFGKIVFGFGICDRRHWDFQKTKWIE